MVSPITPKKVDKKIKDFCNSINKKREPSFIKVVPAENAKLVN